METPVLPWQQEHWHRLYQRLQNKTLAHALLFSGATGMGKRQFAQHLSQMVLCARPSLAGACGVCTACRAFKTGVHPDYREITVEADSKVIKIDQIRGLVEFMSLTAQFSGYKVTVIHPAEAMNTAAANSLLKTLEEPTANSLLLLISAQPAWLPATIRSRCQQWAFRLPPMPQALAWLQQQPHTQHPPELLLALANGSPLRAIELAQQSHLHWRLELLQDLHKLAHPSENRLKIAAKWHTQGVIECLYWLSSLVMDMIRWRLTGTVTQHLDLQTPLAALAQPWNIQALYAYLDQLRQATHLLTTTANTELLLETVFLAWNPPENTVPIY